MYNPKDGSPIASSLNEASEEQVNDAVRYAEEAFKGPWSKLTGARRGQCLNRFADLLDAHAEEIAYLESHPSGRPISMLKNEIPRVSAVFRYYAGWADKIKGDSYPPDDHFFKIVQQVPLGVCAGVTAWNGSLHFLGILPGCFCNEWSRELHANVSVAWKAAPALACGNVSIIKPSEKSPLGTLACAYLIEAAGFPPGVFQILAGGSTVGAALASHPKIAKISFTGSTAVGRKIQDAATRSNMKRVTLELGGKSPAIVFEDAGFETALFWCVLGITVNSGQICAATSRLFVQESIAEEFLSQLKQKFESITKELGADPQDQSTTYGPLVDKIQYDNVQKFIQNAKESSGASLITGGEKYTGKGFYVSPTIFMNPDEDAEVYRNEVFGPVLCVKTFKTEDEAVELANDTSYGLAGSVFTKDLARALRVSTAVRSGTLCVNCAAMVGPQVPMGGFGESGYGRELGEYALRHYTESKTIWVK